MCHKYVPHECCYKCVPHMYAYVAVSFVCLSQCVCVLSDKISICLFWQLPLQLLTASTKLAASGQHSKYTTVCVYACVFLFHRLSSINVLILFNLRN